MVYAPVIVPTLNRYEHLQRLVSSLQKNKEAIETELIIGLDYPPSDKYKDGWIKIKNYLPTITGFKRVKIIEAEKNLGATENLNILKQYVWDEGYDRYIVSEDDNEFSPNFLSYMNWGLEKFKDEDRVVAISAYNYPIDMSFYSKDYYFAHYFSAWGCGRTKKQEEYLKEHVFKKEFLSSLLKSPYKILKICFRVGWRMVLDIILLYKNNNIYGDCFQTYYQWTENRFCVFPKISKVRNWGHDGSGLHSGDSDDEANIYHNQDIDDQPIFNPNTDEVPVVCNSLIDKRLKRFFHKDKLPFADRFKKK